VIWRFSVHIFAPLTISDQCISYIKKYLFATASSSKFSEAGVVGLSLRVSLSRSPLFRSASLSRRHIQLTIFALQPLLRLASAPAFYVYGKIATLRCSHYANGRVESRLQRSGHNKRAVLRNLLVFYRIRIRIYGRWQFYGRIFSRRAYWFVAIVSAHMKYICESARRLCICIS
jgi:hypothetical protein